MFGNCQPVEEDVVLRTDSQAASDQVYVFGDVESIDLCVAHGGWDEPCQHGYGGSLPGTVVTQKCCDLSLVHVETELVHSNFTLLGIL